MAHHPEELSARLLRFVRKLRCACGSGQSFARRGPHEFLGSSARFRLGGLILVRNDVREFLLESPACRPDKLVFHVCGWQKRSNRRAERQTCRHAQKWLLVEQGTRLSSEIGEIALRSAGSVHLGALERRGAPHTSRSRAAWLGRREFNPARAA